MQFHWSIVFTGQSKFYVLPCLKLRHKNCYLSDIKYFRVDIFGHDYIIDHWILYKAFDFWSKRFV